MLKYIVCLVLLIPLNPCFSADKAHLSISTNESSINRKQQIRKILDYLKKEDQTTKRVVRNTDENMTEKELEKLIANRNRDIRKKWEIVLGEPEYNAYIRDLFQKEDFALWMTESPDPLFYAIHSGNMEMVRFFSKPEGIFNLFEKRYGSLPWLFTTKVQNKKQQIRKVLDYLKKEDQTKKRMVRNIDKNMTERELEKLIANRNHEIHKKWEIVLGDPKYNAYVKDLFQKEDFALWMAKSPDPLFSAIQSGSIEMVRFFSKPEGIFNLFMQRHMYFPWGVAIIIQNIEVIKFYLNNYSTDITMKDAQLLNVFHYVFLGASANGHKDKKKEIAELFFEKRYFSRISHLLNEPNNTGATTFDYLLRDTSIVNMEAIMEQFLINGAVPLQLAPILLDEELKDDLEKGFRYDIYKNRRIIKTDPKKDAEYYIVHGIKAEDYTEEGKKIKQKIVSNIRAYQCNRSILNNKPKNNPARISQL